MKVDIKNLTIKQARVDLDNKKYTSRELTEAFLDQIKKVNPEINAYLEVFEDSLNAADLADKAIDSGNIFPLTGIPISIKDNILIEGKRATSGSKILQGF